MYAVYNSNWQDLIINDEYAAASGTIYENNIIYDTLYNIIICIAEVDRIYGNSDKLHECGEAIVV